MQEKTGTFIQAIVIISAIFTLVAAFVVAYLLYFNKRKATLIKEKNTLQEDFQKQLLQSRTEVQEATFQHIGKELHDNVGQLLSTTKMLLGVTALNLGTVPDTLTTATATLSKAIQELRLVSRSLDREWLLQFSFIDNLNNEIEWINAGGVVAAKFACAVDIDMKPEEQIILFRIVQEAIQNAIRHGKPTRLEVDFREDGNKLLLSILDNGGGLPAHFHGMGTTNMRHRTQLFGGAIDWHPGEDGGTLVLIQLPKKNTYED
jgi:signal transduction histidine kinase